MDILYNIISLLFLFVICLLPVVFWGYFFSFHNQESSRKNFLFGIFAGAVSTFPILGMEHIFANILPQLNIFAHISSLTDIRSYLALGASLSVITIFIGILFFVLRILSSHKKQVDVLQYLKAGAFYFGAIVFLMSLFFVFSFLEGSIFGNSVLQIEGAPVFMGFVFNSFKLVILYYFVIAFLEEGTKYFAFLSGVDFSQLTGKKGVIFALYIALGFAFFENILYAFGFFMQEGLNLSLVGIILYRSIFSLFIHVFASLVLSYSISRIYELEGLQNKTTIKYVLGGIIGAILIHASFDIFITLGGTIFIFLYFIGGYAYVSKLIFSNS